MFGIQKPGGTSGMQDSSFTRKPLAVAVAVAVGTAFTTPTTAVAQEGEVIEEIITTGIRGSLTRSMDIKRASRGVVDAISAEDIGKFPDANLAESLQRITGVSIDRGSSRGAEGEGEWEKASLEQYYNEVYIGTNYQGAMSLSENNSPFVWRLSETDFNAFLKAPGHGRGFNYQGYVPDGNPNVYYYLLEDNAWRGGGDMTAMYAKGLLLLCGQPWNGHFWQQFHAGRFSRRSLIALSAGAAGDVGQALVIGVGVHRGDEAFLDAVCLVQDLGDRRQAVGRAGRIADDVVALRIVLPLVHPHHRGQIGPLSRG